MTLLVITIAARYRANLASALLNFQEESHGTYHSHWMATALLPDPVLRDPLREWLEIRGIGTRPAFCPIQAIPIYVQPLQVHSVAEDIASRGANLPSWLGLNEVQVDPISKAIREFVQTHSGAN